MASLAPRGEPRRSKVNGTRAKAQGRNAARLKRRAAPKGAMRFASSAAHQQGKNRSAYPRAGRGAGATDRHLRSAACQQHVAGRT